jgi:hypothetical protein
MQHGPGPPTQPDAGRPTARAAEPRADRTGPVVDLTALPGWSLTIGRRGSGRSAQQAVLAGKVTTRQAVSSGWIRLPAVACPTTSAPASLPALQQPAAMWYPVAGGG